MRRKLKERVIILENVVRYGSEEIRMHLGDLYIVIRAEGNTNTMGWSIDRLRQLLLLILKVWGLSVLRDHDS